MICPKCHAYSTYRNEYGELMCTCGRVFYPPDFVPLSHAVEPYAHRMTEDKRRIILGMAAMTDPIPTIREIADAAGVNEHVVEYTLKAAGVVKPRAVIAGHWRRRKVANA